MFDKSEMAAVALRKYLELQATLGLMQGVVIAFSGGVDSTLLLKVAVDVLGNEVITVTDVSETATLHENAMPPYARALNLGYMRISSSKAAMLAPN